MDGDDTVLVTPAMTTAVLFDLDDTLFDHRGCARDALAGLRDRHSGLRCRSVEAMETEYGRLLESMHLRVLSGQLTAEEARAERFERLFAFAGVPIGRDEARDAARAYRAAYVAAWRPVAFASELLAALHVQAPIGLVTNNVAAEQRQKIAACGFEACLDAIVISEEAGVTKPDPRIFKIALERLGQQAEGTVMVGNSWETDILGARAAGIRPIWFNPSGAPSPDPSVTEFSSLQPTEDLLSVVLARPSAGSPSPGIRTPNPEPRIPSPGGQ
jgi:HAD superfamily hydrolase (TIGR01549 family)